VVRLAPAQGLGSLKRLRAGSEWFPPPSTALTTRPRLGAGQERRLFLTVKTIETHLRNIFRKLDVSSRVEVARLLERERREESR
jgi:hypothetical protein